MGKRRTKKDFQIGDYIFYEFMGTDFIKGRILELYDREAEIEIGFCSKKSEEVHKEKMKVEYQYLIPVIEFMKMKKEKNIM